MQAAEGARLCDACSLSFDYVRDSVAPVTYFPLYPKRLRRLRALQAASSVSLDVGFSVAGASRPSDLDAIKGAGFSSSLEASLSRTYPSVKAATTMDDTSGPLNQARVDPGSSSTTSTSGAIGGGVAGGLAALLALGAFLTFKSKKGSTATRKEENVPIKTGPAAAVGEDPAMTATEFSNPMRRAE